MRTSLIIINYAPFLFTYGIIDFCSLLEACPALSRKSAGTKKAYARKNMPKNVRVYQMEIFPMDLFHWFSRTRGIYFVLCTHICVHGKLSMNESPETHNIDVCVWKRKLDASTDSTLFDKIFPTIVKSACRFVCNFPRIFFHRQTFDGYSSSHWKLHAARNILSLSTQLRLYITNITQFYGFFLQKAAHHFMATFTEQ